MESALQLLSEARLRYSQVELAELLETDPRSIRRWEVGESDPPKYLVDALRQRVIPFKGTPPDKAKFKFKW